MAKSQKFPLYLKFFRSGRLQERISTANKLLHHCSVCPHNCGIDRLKGETGLCRCGAKARVASFGAHFGEESPLVGNNGSGTIFFEGCNLLCLFCQNSDISHIDGEGDDSPQAVDDEQLADIMISLQQQGCHNINLVTPTHVVPQIISALPLAIEKGLNIPLVYNSGGYDRVETLRLLDGIVDIYMPDCKFSTASTGRLYTQAENYPEQMRLAVLEMHRQVGDLKVDDSGIAYRGLLIRHLVMPGHLDETRGIVQFIAENISADTYLNIMDQYRPCHRAFGLEPINRSLSSAEYSQALKLADQAGLKRLDQRDWKKIMDLLGL